jgi:gluconate 2-dehydrogenase subunit 3-like protein
MVTSRATEVFENMDGAKKNNLERNGAEAVATGMTRREAARRLMGAVSAGAFLQFGATDHPIWKHLASDSLLHLAEVAAAGGTTKFLNPQQFASLVAVAEAIVPGSTKAKVAEFVDLLLGVHAEVNQIRFVTSLKQIESESQTKFAKAFAALSEAQKAELLTAVEASYAFKDLKAWVSGAYYSSEIGMRELGWTPNRFFPQFPGCEHSGDHASD